MRRSMEHYAIEVRTRGEPDAYQRIREQDMKLSAAKKLVDAAQDGRRYWFQLERYSHPDYGGFPGDSVVGIELMMGEVEIVPVRMYAPADPIDFAKIKPLPLATTAVGEIWRRLKRWHDRQFGSFAPSKW
jgi:hypothetical protein